MDRRSRTIKNKPCTTGKTILLLLTIIGLTLVPSAYAFAELSVDQVQLYFMEDGRRTETTVAVGTRDLKAHADLQVDGAGQLEGYWEVDGRRLENVSRRINFKQTVTLTTSPTPGAPAFEPGLHRVRFVVTSPALSFTPPSVNYFVSGTGTVKAGTVSLKKPKDQATLSGKTSFKWRKLEGSDFFILTFTDEDSDSPVYAALVDRPRYVMGKDSFPLMFEAGSSYRWKVTGVNEQGDIIGESEARRFTVKKD